MMPGRKFSQTTSACRTRSYRTSRPRSRDTSSAIDFLFRLMARKYADSPSGRNGGPIMRIGSPPSGSSILITSAPRSASSIEPYGPASMRERSRTRTPSKSFISTPTTDRRPQPRQEALGCDGQLVASDAGRVLDRVADRGRDGDDAGLAEALGAERSFGVDGLDQADLDLRHVVGLEDRVVHEGLGHHLSPLDDEPLGERVAESHVDTAVHLSLGGRRVERPAHVVSGGHLANDDPAD